MHCRQERSITAFTQKCLNTKPLDLSILSINLMLILSIITWHGTIQYYVRWQLAGLSADDMIAVNNMRCLCADTKKSSGGGFTLKFDVHKVKVLGSISTCISNLHARVCSIVRIENRKSMDLEKSEQGKNQHGRYPDFILL